jgi:site-specific recombinase XerD
MIDINGWIQQFEKWLAGPNFTNPYSQVSIRGYCAHARRFLDALDYDGVEDLSEVSIAMVRKYIRTGQHGEKSKRSSQYVKMATFRKRIAPKENGVAAAGADSRKSGWFPF